MFSDYFDMLISKMIFLKKIDVFLNEKYFEPPLLSQSQTNKVALYYILKNMNVL